MSIECWLLRTMVFLTARNVSVWVLFLLSLSVQYCAAEGWQIVLIGSVQREDITRGI